MRDVLFVLVGVVVFAALLFVVLVFSLRRAHARIRFEKIRRELIVQGRYDEWARENRLLLTSKAIVKTGVLAALPGSLFFFWQGYRQIGLLFLVIFVICLVALTAINWILYNKIHQDLDQV
jgi:hypothetical protein